MFCLHRVWTWHETRHETTDSTIAKRSDLECALGYWKAAIVSLECRIYDRKFDVEILRSFKI